MILLVIQVFKRVLIYKIVYFNENINGHILYNELFEIAFNY